jgi:hypothetical protein
VDLDALMLRPGTLSGSGPGGHGDGVPAPGERAGQPGDVGLQPARLGRVEVGDEQDPHGYRSLAMARSASGAADRATPAARASTSR